ncbi:hypothetical protein DASC09_001050 [Saccharomycopsis crataegensis]|uniref:NADH dehydrogenase [ubiquinone] 1 beta subcomplex subunit 9 n=1 Tax=Saccharomycopsis crataegensis TaxID=43959 RepID=A0AAV5QEE0_9ASCO|nr:hypothetical protein DASC09_001050 [Saccharomycopsis crataegensis]
MTGVLPFTEANRKIVTLFYRRSLKLAYSWINRRDLYRKKAVEIRQQFEANKQLDDPKQLQHILKNTESLLYKYRHPDPIVPASRPGGTKFERNLHPSLDKPIPGHY